MTMQKKRKPDPPRKGRPFTSKPKKAQSVPSYIPDKGYIITKEGKFKYID